MPNRPPRANDVQVDTVRRARCRIPDCGWTGPDRETYVQANGDRQEHLDWHREGGSVAAEATAQITEATGE